MHKGRQDPQAGGPALCVRSQDSPSKRYPRAILSKIPRRRERGLKFPSRTLFYSLITTGCLALGRIENTNNINRNAVEYAGVKS